MFHIKCLLWKYENNIDFGHISLMKRGKGVVFLFHGKLER